MTFDDAVLEKVRAVGDWHFDTHNLSNSAIFPGPRRLSDHEDLASFARSLIEQIEKDKTADKSTFVTTCESVRFRVQELSRGYFAVRTLRDVPIAMEHLGFPKPYTDLLLSNELRSTGGLVLVCGPTGSGKTTTVSSTVAARLHLFGGYLMTIEDPPEYALAGWHGENGYCDQVQIRNGNYRAEMINGLRGFPSEDRSMLLFGEIRESIAASELLRLGVDGHLLFTTIHSDGPITAITRLLSIAKEEVGEAEARQLLGASLKLVLHQRRDNKVPQLTALRCDRQEDQPIRTAISKMEGQIASIGSYIAQQKIQLESLGF